MHRAECTSNLNIDQYIELLHSYYKLLKRMDTWQLGIY